MTTKAIANTTTTELKVKDKGKRSFNQRILDVERQCDYLECELTRMKLEFRKTTEYINSVIDRVNKGV